MLRNYLVTALRNLGRNWLYGAISILGMAVAGLAILLSFVSAAQPAAVPAPERNIETGLVFPNTIGPARKVGSVDYSQTKAAPELGWAWNYETNDDNGGNPPTAWPVMKTPMQNLYTAQMTTLNACP